MFSFGAGKAGKGHGPVVGFLT